MKKYFVVKVNSENGDSRNILVSERKDFTEMWAEKNNRYYNNSLSVEEIEDNKIVARFYSNTSRHHGKYQTRVLISRSIEDQRNGIILHQMKTSKFNTEEGVDQEAQRSYLLKKIQKQFGKDIFCIY